MLNRVNEVALAESIKKMMHIYIHICMILKAVWDRIMSSGSGKP